MAARYQRRPYQAVIFVLAVAALIAFRLYDESGPEPPEVVEAGQVRVERVVDGDTLLLDDRARVRLIGVNTPESVKPDHPVEPYGPEASAFTRAFVAGGDVRLQFDRERKDQYGRFLAYVWVGDQMLNEELLRAGLARATLRYHFSESMKRRFRKAQEEAQAAKRGIWSQ